MLNLQISGVFLTSLVNCLAIQEGDTEHKVYQELGQPAVRIALPSGVTMLSYQIGDVLVKDGLVQKVQITSSPKQESDSRRVKTEQSNLEKRKQAEFRDAQVYNGTRSPWEPDLSDPKGVFVEQFGVGNVFTCVLRNNSENPLAPAQVLVSLSSKTNSFEPFAVRLRMVRPVPQILPGESIAYYGDLPDFPQRRMPSNFNDSQVGATVSVYSGSIVLKVNQSSWSRNYRLVKGKWVSAQSEIKSK